MCSSLFSYFFRKGIESIHGVRTILLIRMEVQEAILILDHDELIHYLHIEIHMKGRHEELVGTNALSLAIQHMKSTAVIIKLIEMGGKELVMKEDARKSTTLFTAFTFNAPMEVISRLIDVGGKDLVLKKNEIGKTALNLACLRGDLDIISNVIDTGGQDLVSSKDQNGLGAIHYYFPDDYPNGNNRFDECFTLLLKEGILAQFGGEFGLGGLFIEEENIQRIIYDQWEDLAVFLELVIRSLHEEQKPPILHAAINAKAPRFIISMIIERFDFYDCILRTDSLNRLPIDVAVKVGLRWKKGMKVVTEATAESLQHPVIYVAAQYGLTWSNGMREIVESNVDEVVHGCDNLTGLSLFMVAANGNASDLSSIYGMLRINPERI